MKLTMMLTIAETNRLYNESMRRYSDYLMRQLRCSFRDAQEPSRISILKEVDGPVMMLREVEGLRLPEEPG